MLVVAIVYLAILILLFIALSILIYKLQKEGPPKWWVTEEEEEMTARTRLVSVKMPIPGSDSYKFVNVYLTEGFIQSAITKYNEEHLNDSSKQLALIHVGDI